MRSMEYKLKQRESVLKSRILIINTGGTIGMKPTPRGYRPEPGFLVKQMEMMPELKDAEIPEYTMVEYDPVLDSSNVSPEHWQKMANDIIEHHDQFDGFVIIHGTDTMAYTASGLSFMLANIKKPVVLTGSQIPLCQIRNDARENLITAMEVASKYPAPEIGILFASKFLRGCRSTKTSTSRFDAFDSPNFPPLGTVGTKVKFNRSLAMPVNELPIEIRRFDFEQVAALRLTPGISAEILKNLLSKPLKGLVLEAFGAGNGPSNNPEFLKVLTEASNDGVVIVSCSQCQHGGVDLDDYSAGVAMADSGVVSGGDMTVEAALAKLAYLIEHRESPEHVRESIKHNLAGELTVA